MRLYLHRDAADPESLALTSHGRGDLAGMMPARAQVLRLLVLAIGTIFVLKAAANREKPLSSAVSGAGASASAAWRGSTDWAKEVAQIGAVIGREFSHALLAAVARETGPELASALDRLRAARLLFRQGEPPHATYLFKHALVQDAAYGTLLREPRRALHARIADALESRFTGIAESQPELLARHCTEAGLVQKAAALWGKAGLEAHALWVEFWSGNYVTAGRLVEQGVVLADEKRAMHWKTLGMIGCGCLFSVTGDASNALQMLTSGIAAYRSTGATVWMPMILSHLARTYAALDKLDEALH